MVVSTFTFASLSGGDAGNGILPTKAYAYVNDDIDLDGGDGFGAANDDSNTDSNGNSDDGSEEWSPGFRHVLAPQGLLNRH